MTLLRRVNTVIEKIVDFLCWTVMLALICIVFFQVVNRFAIKVPAAWTEEFGRYVFVWLSLIGTVKGIKEGAHLNVDVLLAKVSGKTKVLVLLIADILSVLFFIILGITGWNYAVRNMAVMNDTGQVPMFLVYVAIPICSLLCIPLSLERLLRVLKEAHQS